MAIGQVGVQVCISFTRVRARLGILGLKGDRDNLIDITLLVYRGRVLGYRVVGEYKRK